MPHEEAGRRARVIRPGRKSTVFAVSELWRYRELLLFVIWREIKVRYKQTAFGAAWAVLQPVLLMVVFSVFLGRLAGLSTDGYPYPAFYLSALVPWTLFSQSLSGASSSLIDNSNIITKVYFPRLLLPIGVAASYLVDFGIALVVLIVLLLLWGIPLSPGLVLLVPLTALAFASAVGIGAGLAAMNARYRDVRYAVPFLIQLGLFLSPIAYPASLLAPEMRPIYALNPVVGVVEGFRSAVLGGPFPLDLVAIGTASTMLLLAGGLTLFRRAEARLADVI